MLTLLLYEYCIRILPSSCLPFTHVHRIRSGLLLHSSNRDNIALSDTMHMFRLTPKYSYRFRDKRYLGIAPQMAFGGKFSTSLTESDKV